MSDEFNVPNRTFKDGDDPLWTALDKSDDDASSAGGGSLHFYNSSSVTSEDGRLKIKSSIKKKEWEHYDATKKKYRKITKYFDSGMVQSWNKFCFTGGILEVDLIFPGDPTIGGLWPAAWMLGNLGRATYEASTNMIWPWSYNTCNRELQEPQQISACNKQNHFGLNEYQGRGATEIDIVEMMAGGPGTLPSTDPPISLPYADMTLQVGVVIFVFTFYIIVRFNSIFSVFFRFSFKTIILDCPGCTKKPSQPWKSTLQKSGDREKWTSNWSHC